MKKKLIGWTVVIAIVAGMAAAYFTIRPLRRFIDDAVARLGFGGSQESVTYWCPMHPEVVRKKSGVCPV